jgi:hypothetical protein
VAYKTNLIRQSYEPPPWVRDPLSADCWVTLPQAGVHYFRRKYKNMRFLLTSGTLEEFGFPTYFDGTRWWVRLPVAMPEIAQKDS